MTTELLLIRHGESEGNVGRSKDPNCPLTDLGLEQATTASRGIARYDLRGFVGVTSPYRRAVQTAEAIARATGITFTIDEAVREWGEAATVGERLYPREQLAEVIERLNGFLRRHQGGKVLAVSHAAPIAVLTHLAWGERPSIEGNFWAAVGNCCPRWVKTTCSPGSPNGQAPMSNAEAPS
jgi:broad specificity phosphatase PhoE